MDISNNRTKQFVKNVVGSALLQVVTIVTGFISPKLMLSAFGSEINGITSSILQFISYIALIEAGLGNATVFALYKPLADKDTKERDSIISAARISYNRVGIIFVFLSVILAFVYPFIAKTDVLGRWELSFLVLALCCNFTINFFVLAKYRSLLTADQCGYLVSIASGAQLITNLIIVYLGIKAGFGVAVVRGLAVLSFGVTTIVLALITRLRYGKIDFYAKPNMKALDKRWDAMFTQILGVVISGSPIIIMTALLNFKQISVYSVYNMIAGSVSTCITVFTSGLAAGFGNIYAIGDEKLLKKTTEEFRTAFYIIITIIYSTTSVLLVSFVKLYTKGINDVNYIVPLFGFLIVMNGLINNFRAPHGMLIFSFGKFKESKRPTLFQAIITVVFCFIFTKWLGLVGCMLALCISNLYMLIEFIIMTPKYLVPMSIFKNVWQIFLSTAITIGSYFVFKFVGYQPNTYLQWIIFAFIVGIVNLIITLVLYFIFDKENTINLYKRFKCFFKIKKNN